MFSEGKKYSIVVSYGAEKFTHAHMTFVSSHAPMGLLEFKSEGGKKFIFCVWSGGFVEAKLEE